MAAQHVSIPKSFKEGDAREWFQRFKICCRANEWNDAKKALKLPTLYIGRGTLEYMVRSYREGTSQIQSNERKDHYQT